MAKNIKAEKFSVKSRTDDFITQQTSGNIAYLIELKRAWEVISHWGIN